MPSTTRSESSVDLVPANLFAARPPDLENDRYPNERSSVGKRVFIPLLRFLVFFCAGVAATLAWWSDGDREMSANSYQQSNSAPQATQGAGAERKRLC
jgi:hypothetical protein